MRLSGRPRGGGRLALGPGGAWREDGTLKTCPLLDLRPFVGIKKQFFKSGSGRRDAGMLSKNNATSHSARKMSTSSPGGGNASSFQEGRLDNLPPLGILRLFSVKVL